MPLTHKKFLTTSAILMSVFLATAGCGYSQSNSKPKVNSRTPEGRPAVNYYEKSYITDNNGKFWIPIKPAVHALGYRVKDQSLNGGDTKIGYTDVMYTLKSGSTEVESLGQKVSLQDAPQLCKGQIYMTPASLSKLLQTEIGWNPTTGEIDIAPPTDPDSGNPEDNGQAGTLQAQSLSAADSEELVAYAKKFLGVPYDFGAGAYEDTKKFDCSSFTQHVFKKFGVNLPRLARDQDNVGTRVSRKELKTGDLIFFTVPGRFESDAVPGHVGIYIGDGKFIHTWGDPGVQISNLDTGYWSNVILHMQRVL